MLVYTPDFPQKLNANSIGEKAFNLSQLHDNSIVIPDWMAVTAQAFTEHVPDEITVQEKNKVLAHITSCSLLPALLEQITETARQFSWSEKTLCAVRSSAIGEDSAEHSFAGQMESFRYVPFREVFATIKKVWLSAFSDRAISYREKNGLSGKPVRVAVIIQEMIHAEVAGVSFGMNPVTGRRNSVVISAVYGLGEGLVSGLLDADTYTVNYSFGKDGTLAWTVDQQLVEKNKAVMFDGESGKYTCIFEVPAEKRNVACLTNDEIGEITQLTIRLNNLLKGPQDIEWAIAHGTVYLLQSRPITTCGSTPDFTAPKRIWDNANIVESYAGITTPLTYSFVQEIYTAVYQHFCRIMGVEEDIIQKNRTIFSMLGCIKGRIYYNLNSWYQVLSLLPGYSMNASFMEQMMGVTEKMELLPTVVHSNKNKYLRFLLLIRKLIINFLTLSGQIKDFYRLLNTVLSPVATKYLEHCSPHQSKEQYIRLEQSLLQRWQAPLVNDFYAMIFYGLLKKVIKKWGIDSTETLQNDLLCGEGGIISTVPIKAMRELANDIIRNDTLFSFMLHTTDQDIVARLDLTNNAPDKSGDAVFLTLKEKITAYLDLFGDRCINELKLETITPKHDPAIVIRMLKSYCKAGYTDLQKAEEKELTIRRTAMQKVNKHLRWRPVRNVLFSFLLKNTRLLIKNRENLRFERTRLYSRIREIFLAMGTQFEWEHFIASKRDIFYLTKDEIFDFIDGTSVHTNLKEIISMRKAQYAAFEKEQVPNRFTTYGVVYQTNAYESAQESDTEREDQLQGIGCCPGIITAKVCFVDDPNNAPDITGCIMVAKRTDPGWAPLFPMARGLLVERGSLLSHSAIVAREMGIPAIVGVPDLMAILNDGETVAMDGTTGTIALLERCG